MKPFGQERSTEAVIAQSLSPSAGLSGDSLPAWDKRTWLLTIPLAMIVIYAFMPTLANDFVGWDDDKNFLDNPYFHGLGAAEIKWAWSTSWLGVYQPLAWLLFETQYACSQLDPRGYHLTSLLLQVANAVVLYVLTVALLVRCRTDSCLESPWTCSLSAGLATALFAVHPLRVEAVAWASCQPYLPCALFSMLSILAYFRAFRTSSSPRWGWLAGSFVLFVAALLFHPVPVNLPAVLLILDVYPLRRLGDRTDRWFGASTRSILLEKVPFVIASLLFMGVAIAVRVQSPFLIEPYNVSEGIAQACYAIWFYIWKTVAPLDLAAMYPLPKDLNWLALPYGFCICGTLALSAGLLLLRRGWPGLLAAWLSYLVLLAPNSGIIRNNNFVITGDRYSYIAMLGSVALAAACFWWLWRKSWRWHPVGAIGMIAIGLGALLGLTAMTRNQCRIWRNTEVLWAHALTHGANSSDLAHNNWGYVLYSQGKYEAAAAHFNEALRLNPGYTDAHYNLGTTLSSQRRYAEAEAHFAEAIRLYPGHIDAHNSLGNLLYTQGKYKAAAAHLTETLRLNPLYDKAHNNLGNVLYSQGKHEAAVCHYIEALRLNPGYVDAHYNLGNVFFTMGKYEAAAAHYAEAIRLRPGYADAHKNLGDVLYAEGKYEGAAAHYAEALRLNPGYADAHDNLGTILSRQKEYAKAEGHFAAAIRLNPEYVQAHYKLGLVCSHLGNYEAARAQFALALRLQPGDPKAYNASAMLMAACPEAKFRDGKGAVQFATRACELTKWKEPIILDTLAAAQAEAGDFDAAVTSQKRAIELLTDERQKDDYCSRVVLYQAKKPYRQLQAPRQYAPSKASP